MRLVNIFLLGLVVLYANDLPILQTGQTKIYHDGDNGTHQAGIKRSYTKKGEVIIDNSTGLMWQNQAYTQKEKEAEDANKEHGKVLKWANASKYCDELTLGGYDDWKLPTLKELKTLVDYSQHNPAIDAQFEVIPDYYWTRTTYADDTADAWVVGFDDGGDGWSTKSGSDYVRCVRGQ